MKLAERCQSIELIVSDVDGVLTDGTIVYDNQGIESKRFHIRDGSGIVIWQRAGYRFGLLTGRSSHVVEVRAAELGVTLVRQGVEDKLAALRALLAELKLAPERVCYLGDDLPDLAAVRFVGLGVAVADACAELRQAADYTTQAPGGAAAVREVIELILKAHGRWDEIVQKFDLGNA